VAISYVGGVVAGRTGNSNSTVDVSLSSGLTGGSNSGVSAGDLVIVTVCTGSAARSSVVAVTSPATYDNLTAQHTTATTYDTNVQVSYKFMPSTPDGVVTIPAQGNIADGQVYAVQVFRGVDSTTPLDVTPTYATGSGANNRPDPAAILPVTAGAWIVVTGGGASAAGGAYTTGTLTDFLNADGADTNDASLGVGYYDAWVSDSYDPVAFGGGSTNAANSWGATTIALRPAPETQALTPALFTNSNTFYTHTVSVGAVALTATLYDNSNVFYTHVVTQPAANQDLIASLYENSNTFYDATVNTSITLSATRYDNSNTFYSPTVTAGTVTLTANLYTNDNTFYQPSVIQGALTLFPSLYSNTNEFYSQNVVVGSVSLSPSLYSNSSNIPLPSISLGAVQLTPSLYENVNVVYLPTVIKGVFNLQAELYTNSNNLFLPTITQGVTTLNANLFINLSEFYSARLSQTLIGGFPLESDVAFGVVYGDTAQYVGSNKPKTTLDITTNRLNKPINNFVSFSI